MTQEKLEEAKRLYQTANQDQKYVLESLFPELAESEDEKIRKELIMHFKNNSVSEAWSGLNVKKVLVWLEKQSEKQEKTPIWKHWKDGIAGNGEGKPIYLIKQGYTYSLSSCLSFECDYIELSELDKLLSEKQGEQKSFDYENADFAPKTALEAAKEEKIDNQNYIKSDDKDEPENFKKQVMSEMTDLVKDYIRQKPTWSEEDEEHINDLIEYFSQNEMLENNKEDIVIWLKSLKDKYTWKPSDEQMKVIEHICDGDYKVDLDILDSIYRDFKKLKEE